jgi:hypothetical protein
MKETFLIKEFLQNFSKEDAELYEKLASETIEYIFICKNPLGSLKIKLIGQIFHHAYLLLVFKQSKRMVYFGVGGIHLRLTDTTKIAKNTKVHPMKLTRKLTLMDLFNNYIEKYSIDFVYTPSQNNCQMFVHRVLDASKLLTKNIIIFDKGLHQYMTTHKPKLNQLFNTFTSLEHRIQQKKHSFKNKLTDLKHRITQKKKYVKNT